jgi:hypothetical protein
MWLSPEERKKRTTIRQKYSPVEYDIYKDLDKIADSLEDRHWMRNQFKKYSSKKLLVGVSTDEPAWDVRNPHGIAITNPQTKEQLKDTIASNPLIDTTNGISDEVAQDFETEAEEEEYEEGI